MLQYVAGNPILMWLICAWTRLLLPIERKIHFSLCFVNAEAVLLESEKLRSQGGLQLR
jgi:hypothetical protein